MQLFRSQELTIVENRLVSRPTGLLDLYLDPQDVESLVDPNRRYTMDRFMGCTDKGSIPGWASEDKIHVRLDTPRTSEEIKRLAELHLDQGGDLYFTIWDGGPLRKAGPHEEFEVDTLVTFDPGDKLRQVGIEIVRLHQLSELALQLGSH